LQDYRSFSSSSSSIIFFFRVEELGWMDDGTDDGTDGWKGRPPPDRLRILYIKIYKASENWEKISSKE
jgi:hypothetical protein